MRAEKHQELMTISFSRQLKDSRLRGKYYV